MEDTTYKNCFNKMEKVFLKLREISFEFPDGTIMGIGRMERVTHGWVVRVNEATDFEGEDGMIEAIQIASRTTKTVAGSKDGEVELWDVVAIFDDEEEATKAGKLNGQMAIYQIETARLKWLS